MPPEVAFWTGIWDPAREALSKEVQTLRGALTPRPRVFSFSSGQRSDWRSRDGVVRLSGRRWMLLRALAAAFERRAQISHVFGEMYSWHLLRALGRRPVLFTVAISGDSLPANLYNKVSLFVAETETLADSLRRAGIARERIRVIYPGVDLDRLRPATRRSETFRVLFASSPASPDHFDRRGIPLLIEAARTCPEIEVLLLWRQWGDRPALDRALQALEPPPNVSIRREDVADMGALYRTVHATVWMAADGYGKSCPNSVIEGLAAGCPSVVSNACGIGDLIVSSGAGVISDRTPSALATALRVLRATHAERSGAARDLAERLFNVQHFIDSYRGAYEDVASGQVVT